MRRDVPDWIIKALPILIALSGWPSLAFTAALGIVLFAPTPPGIDLQSIRDDWGGWFFVGLVFFGLIALVRFAQWVVAMVGLELQEKSEKARKREERKQHESHVLSYLDTLSSEENQVLNHLVENNQRTAVGMPLCGVLHTLRTK